MTPAVRAAMVILGLMFAASVLAYALKPTRKLVETNPREKLENLIPTKFGDWHGLPTENIVLADPVLREKLDTIYSETLSRTYVDTKGRRIMLSVAYGDDQRDKMEMHYPEICYPAQGFQTRAVVTAQLFTRFGPIQVKRLEMVLGQRNEPVTYWTVIGDHATLGGIGKKLNEMRYSLKGVIPDGLLFRVSSIERDTATAYRDQEEFVGALLEAVSPEARKRLAGL